MKKLIGITLVIAAMTGCAAGDVYDPSPDLEPGAIAAAKADGAFGSTEISLGERVTGNAAGTAIALFALELEAGDEMRVTVTRASGDLAPSAYLYRGTEHYVAPDDYDTADGRVTLNYGPSADGTHHIVVKAYEGVGAGEFELVTECTGGPCAGISADPVQRQSDCIEAAAQCSIAALPRYDGRVGDVTARRVFNDCLDAQADESCRTACDEEGAPVCGEVVAALPDLADQTMLCRDLLSSCLDDCAGMGGFYTPGSIGEAAASACWTGYFGNCAEFIGGHQACGGTEYDVGSVGECRARCAAVEGAWDEGPWDGCMEECDEIARQHDDFIREVADEAGEYVGVDSHEAFAAVRWDDVPSDVKWTVERRIRDFNELAESEGRTDTAALSDENILTISRDGEVVGYMIGVDYWIDHTLFDGGGINLYLNLEGEVVSDEEWWG